MKLKELNVELVQTNAIVLMYRKVTKRYITLVEKKFENHSEFNKWYFENKNFTEFSDKEIHYILINEKGTLIIRV